MLAVCVPRLLQAGARSSGGAEPGCSHGSHTNRSRLLTPPFLCPCLRAGSVSSAASPRSCLGCKEDRQVSSRGVEDGFSKGRKV